MRNAAGAVGLLALARLAVATCDHSPCQPSADAVPRCAAPCISSAVVTDAGCPAATDYQCSCSRQEIIQGAAFNCVLSACEFGDALQVLPSVSALCDCVASHPTKPCPTSTTTTAPPVTTEPPTTTSTTGPITTGPSSCDSVSPCQPSADAVPNCAKPCIESAAVTHASCARGDYQCNCSNQDIIQNNAIECVIGGCGFDTALEVLPAVGALCDCVTAHPTTPCTSAPATTTSSPETITSSPETTTSSPETTTSPPPDTTEKPPLTTTSASTTGPITTGPACDSVSPCQPSADAVPGCAKPCIESAAVTHASCVRGDYQCNCANQDIIQSNAIGCVIGGCGLETALQVLPAVSSLCDCVTAHPTTPCTSAPATTTSSPSWTTSTTSPPDTTEEPPSTTTSPSTTGPITTGPTCDTVSPCQPSADAVPGCAKPCIESAAVTHASCVRGDYQCNCANQDIIQGNAIDCVIGACGFDDALQVLPAVGALCDCVTAHPTTPCPSGPATSTSAPEPTTTSQDSSSQPETTSKTGTTSQPTNTSKPQTTSKPGSTCKPGTTTDCGPVASTAVPSCAQACFSSAAPKVHCDVHDYACQCKPEVQQSLTQLLIPCVATACPPASLPAVITGASSVCACATAPPSPGDCSTTGPGGTETPTKPPVTPTSEPQHGSSSICESGSTPGNTGPVGPTKTGSDGPGSPTKTGGDGGNTGTPTGGHGGQPTDGNGEQPTGGNGEQPTSGHGGQPTGGNGEQPTGGNGGEPTGGNGGNGGGSRPTTPPVVDNAAARFEISLVAGVFGTVWLIAMVL